MASDTESDKEWDVFSGNHFLGHVAAPNKEAALQIGLQLYGKHLEGVLRVQRRVQTDKDGWSRPI